MSGKKPPAPPSRPSFPQDPSFTQAVQNYEAGLKAMQEHKFEKAKPLLEKIIAGGPKELADRARILSASLAQARLAPPALTSPSTAQGCSNSTPSPAKPWRDSPATSPSWWEGGWPRSCGCSLPRSSPGPGCSSRCWFREPNQVYALSESHLRRIECSRLIMGVTRNAQEGSCERKDEALGVERLPDQVISNALSSAADQ